MKREQRLSYCSLVLALHEGDIERAVEALGEIGYSTNQRNRVPERDAEFFLYLLRDVQTKASTKEEAADFSKYRNEQRDEDRQAGEIHL